jgi:hypothetical protein
MEKVNLAGEDRGSQKITGWTVHSAFDGCFCMKKVNEEGNGQENEKENQIEKLFPFSFHFFFFSTSDLVEAS